MAQYHLAQINIGRLIAPIDVRGLQNSLPSSSPSTRWPIARRLPMATPVRIGHCHRYRLERRSHHVRKHVDVGVAGGAARLRYRSDHIRVLRDRAKWFEKLDKPIYCLWWVLAGHTPTVAEGRERMEHYQKYGPTPFSFWFSQHYPQPADESVCV
jgi:Domain of unknown function (DUF3291)